MFFTGFCACFTLGIILIQYFEVSTLPELNHLIVKCEKQKNRRGYSVYRVHLDGKKEPLSVRKEVFLQCTEGLILKKPLGQLYFEVNSQKVLFVPPTLIILAAAMASLFIFGAILYLLKNKQVKVILFLEEHGKSWGFILFAVWFFLLFNEISK